MEKNIHTHLFTSALSTREQRLVFMATPEQQKFDETAAGIENDIENTDTLTDAIIPKIAQLKVSAIADRDNSKRVEELNDILNKKMELEREIADTEKKTSDSNADWKKLTEDIKSVDFIKKDNAVEAAKKLIVDSRARANGLSSSILSLDDLEPRLLGKVTVKAIAAHNKNIENVQALDAANVIMFVPDPKIGGDAAKDALKAIEERGTEFLTTELNAALTALDAAKGPGAKKAQQAKLDKLVKERREEIYQEIRNATVNDDFDSPYVNAEKQVATLLAQLKEMNDEIKAVTMPDVPAVDPTAPGAAPGAAPAVAPSATPAAPTTLVGKGAELLKNAIAGITDIAKNVIAKGAEALDSLQKDLTDKEKSELKDKLNDELKKQGANKHVEQNPATGKLEIKDGAPAEEKKSAEPADEVKTKLQELLDFFKELITFLRGERLGGGDLGVLKSEIESIDEQIAKLEKTEKETKDPIKLQEIKDKIQFLRLDRLNLKQKIALGTKLGSDVVAEAKTVVQSSANAGTPLYLRVEKDKDGNIYLVGTPNAPGATPEKCRSHVQYMTERLKKVHPDLKLNQRASTDQRVYFNIYGDVKINSENRTDNSRTINNINNVSGKNNTVSASADGSQNGNNDQAQFGGVGAEQDAVAKNRANQRPRTNAKQTVDLPPPTPAPAPAPKPRRAHFVDAPPPTGSLS